MKQHQIDHLIESKISRKKEKGLIFGVGHFDVSFPRSIRIGGRQHNHSAYSVWNSMLRRCYAPNTVKMARNYAGCSVCQEWLYFSNFLAFYKSGHRENSALDKDLLIPGNKVYSPERCVFVPQALNNFTLDRARARGDCPLGVCWDKQRGKFKANIRVNGELRHIGLFDTAYGAHIAWHNKKMELAMQLKTMCDELHPALYSGLILKVESMRKAS
ncbi:hypothetical protein ABW11_21145 [Pluralibacter gergoviae]|uniref:AP2 domain-containing protein n=1 Tax=Pluralibacter gergoviae TaxID=61647 RepID=UPI0006512229|nr:AP2 domain-containing protein [Pluralibacter gergoviae]KMK23116.1 hypothetical protein ABW11_21145 [Pluralibacter gergoviae]